MQGRIKGTSGGWKKKKWNEIRNNLGIGRVQITTYTTVLLYICSPCLSRLWFRCALSPAMSLNSFFLPFYMKITMFRFSFCDEKAYPVKAVWPIPMCTNPNARSLRETNVFVFVVKWKWLVYWRRSRDTGLEPSLGLYRFHVILGF